MTPLEAQQAAARVMARCDELAAISTEPDRLTRLYLSAEHRRANHRVGEWMREGGMQVGRTASAISAAVMRGTRPVPRAAARFAFGHGA